MKNFTKLLLILFMSIGFSVNAQSNITNILNETDDFENSHFKLGCCNTDGLNTSSVPVCVFPEFQEYYVTEDIILTKSSYTFRNLHIEFRNGANLITNNVPVYYTCDANITFTGGGQIFESIDEAISTSMNNDSCAVVCHNGSSILTFNESALQGHLGHGDTLISMDCSSINNVGSACTNSSLSLKTFNFNISVPNNLTYSVYTLDSKRVIQGKTNDNFINELPTGNYYILKIDGYEYKLYGKRN